MSAADTSSTFTIDTQACGTTHTMWGDFTIDTRDPDSVVYPLSLLVSRFSNVFTVDTTEPPPEDSDNDRLHDQWER